MAGNGPVKQDPTHHGLITDLIDAGGSEEPGEGVHLHQAVDLLLGLNHNE